MTKRFQVPPLLLLCAAAAAMAAALHLWITNGYGNPAALSFYGSALDQFSQAFWYGDEPYPRLLEHANDGLGSPVFFLYPPIAFWLSAALEPLSGGDPQGILRLEISLFLATFASGATCFLWLRGRYPRSEALTGALVYVLLPVRLWYLCLDANLAQCWALAWLPLILAAIDRMMLGKPRAGAACAVFYALLAMTHMPSFIAFVPVSLAYGALTSADMPKKSWKQLGGLCASLLLSLGLACAYLLPLASLHSAMQKAGPFNPPPYDMPVFFTPDFYACLPLVLIAYVLYQRAGQELRQQLRPWLVLALLTAFLMCPLSRPLWDRLLPLQYLQAPARRFSAMLFPAAAVFGIQMLASAHRSVAASLCLAACVIFTSWPLYTSLQASPSPQAQQSSDATVITPEFFRTKWIAPAMMTPQSLQHWRQAPDAQFYNGQGKAAALQWRTRSMTLSITITSAAAQLVLKRFYFPGWSVLSDNVRTGIKVYPTRPEGLMTLLLPRGVYHLTLVLDHVPGEAAGWFMTLLSLCAVAAWLAISAWRAKSRGQTASS